MLDAMVESRWTRIPEEIEMDDMQIVDRKSKPYHNLENEYADVISEAVTLSADIGGADVSLTFENAKRAFASSDWEKATKLLNDAHRKAKLVLERAPYWEARLAYEFKIKAACKIEIKAEKDKELSEELKAVAMVVAEVKAEWGQIQDSEKAKKYEGLGPRIVELAKTIDTQITPRLKGAQDEKKAELGKLQNKLKETKDPNELRKIANDIFNNSIAAEKLGMDAGEKARAKFEPGTPEGSVIDWNDDLCKATFTLYDWFALKDCRKKGKITINTEEKDFTDEDMWKLVQFRMQVVNEELDKLRKIYPTMIANAAGGEGIDSHIDITVATPQSGDDVKAAKAFNEAIKAVYGKPPGRVFNVNLYPRDYNKLTVDKFKPGYTVEPLKDDDIDEPTEGDSAKLGNIDQDVATLLKQRRFLDETQFNDMLNELINKAPKEIQDQVAKQYEEADAIYLLTSLEKVANIRGNVSIPDDADGPKKDLKEYLRQLDQIKGEGGEESLKKAQQLIPMILNLFEDEFPDETMETTDAMYLDKMAELREDQEKIRELKGPGEGRHPGQTCATAGHEEICNWQKQLDAVEVTVKKNMFTNIIFANNAIMSQGALKHVVGALQAKTLEDKQKVLNGLSASDLMQSANEQVAELFKEMQHYESVVKEAEGKAPSHDKEAAKNRATGEGYVHASKYFFRLLHAAVLLNQKYPNHETVQAPYTEIDSVETDLEKLRDRVENVMLKLRKSADIPAQFKGEVGALEMKEIFQGRVTDIASFRKMIGDFAIELNKRIRALAEFQQSQTVGVEAQKAYGSVAESDKDKAMTKIRVLASKPDTGPKDLESTLTTLGVAEGISGKFADTWRKTLFDRLPRNLDNLNNTLNAISKSNQEAFDELQAVVRFFDNSNTLYAIQTNEQTMAVGFEINEAKPLIEKTEKVLAEFYAEQDKAKKSKTELSKQVKDRLLLDIQATKESVESALQNIARVRPDVIEEQSMRNMIDQVVSDLNRSLQNFERRAAQLG